MANMITNSGFEVDASGWSPVGIAATFDRSLVQFHSGVASGRMVPDDINQGVQTTNSLPFVVGKTYTFSAWARDGGNLRMNLIPAGVILQQKVMTPGVWTEFSVEWVCTQADQFFNFITLDSTPFYIDDIDIDEKVVVVTDPLSKRDDLLASLPGSGTVSDRLYAQEQAAYAGADPTAPLTLNDYLVANGVNKNIIQ